MRRTSLKKILAALILLLSPLTMLAQKETYAALSDGGKTLTFYYDTQRISRGTTYDLNSGLNNPGWYTYDNYETVTKVVFDSSFKDASPTSTYRWFYGMADLTSITGMKEYLNTSEVKTMRSMFYNCSKLTSLDVSGFNTENVTNMSWMFYSCSSLTSLDVSGFNTENVTNMDRMFYTCSSLTSLDLNGFNTAKVENMYSMFGYCSSLTSLDVSGFNTGKVTDMNYMFRNCSSLTTIICNNDWNRSSLTSTNMFSGCTKLKGGNGTTYDADNTNGTYAHPDAAGNPGYFTKLVLGDANGDGKVTITDAVAVVNYILGSTQGVFIKRAANVDENDDISITDAVGIVNIILNASPADVKERRVREKVSLDKDPD